MYFLHISCFCIEKISILLYSYPAEKRIHYLLNQPGSSLGDCSFNAIKFFCMPAIRSVVLRVFLFVVVLLLQFASGNVLAQLSLTNGAPSATVDFSSSMQTTVGSNPSTAFSGAGFEPAPTTAGRLNSNAWAVTGWSDGNLAYGATRTTAGTDYTRGSSATAIPTTGGIYAYTGSPGSVANPALLVQPGGSDFTPGTITLRIRNNGTTIISQLAVSYNLFVRNDQGRSSTFNFSYSTDDVTYTDVTALDYATTVAADALGWVQVGTSPSRSTTITGISVAPTTYIYIRWSSQDNGGGGSRDEIGLDDISVTATYSAACTQPTTQGTVNSFSSVLSSQMDINFTRGNGTGGVLIVASTSSTLSANPISGINYAANTNFGNGDPVGGGFVLYSGTANGAGAAATITATGFAPSTLYYFFIFEYNISVPCYLTPGNSGSQTTAAGSATLPTDYFRSRVSGNWNNSNNWESSSDNITWITATAKPTLLATSITIQNGHTITLSASETAKRLTIASGGILTYANTAAGGYDLDIAADPSDDDFKIFGTYRNYGIQPGLASGATCRVFANGLIQVNGNAGTSTADDFARSSQIYLNTDAIYEWNTTTSFQTAACIYFPNAGATDYAIFRLSQNVGTVGASTATSFLGKFEANASITFANTGTKVFRNGILGTGTITQNSTGQFQINGAQAYLGGTGAINLLVGGGLLVTSTSTTNLISNKTINSSTFTVDGTFDASTFTVSGSTAFILSPAATLIMASPDGITTGALGNIQTSGGRTFDATATYRYNATVNQTTGNALPATITGTLFIDNNGAAGANTTTLTTNNTTVTTFRLNKGLFAAGTGQQINIASSGTVFGQGGNQAQTAAAGYINFTGPGTINPGTGVTLHNVRLNSGGASGVNMGGGNTTITGTLEMAAGGYVTAGTAPTYSSSPASTLQYNCSCNYGVYEEWYANTYGTSAGVPHNVTIAAGSSLNFGTYNTPHEMRGDLSISSTSTFALSTVANGNLNIKGNWTRAAGGTFTHNNRLVRFNGTSGNQTITVTGGGTETFAYLAVDKAAGLTLNLAAAPNATNVTVSGAGGTSFQFYNGDIDLNQNTLLFISFNGSQNNFGVDGTAGNLNRTITSTGGTGTVEFRNTTAGNNVITLLRLSGFFSTVTFASPVTVLVTTTSGPSGMNFGNGLTTINGTLQLNSFAYVTGFAPSYGTNSFLVYNTGSTFDRNVEWCCSSGPGYPYHVIVQGGTNIRLNTPSPNGDADRYTAGNLWIKSGSSLLLSTTATNKLYVGKSLQLDGTLTLPTNVGGDLYVGENWVRTSSGVFTHNDRAVFFNTAQTSTITASGNGQYFPYLYISKNALANTVSLLDSVAIGKEMSVITGTFDPANKDIVLLSDASNTASFGQMGASADVAYSGTGRFIAERYIPTGTAGGQHAKSWQFLAVPTNGGQTINQAWQEGAAVANQNPKPGYGTMITSSITPLPATFDAYTAAGPSIKSYAPATNSWVGPANTTTQALFDKRGYMVFVRGDRSVITYNGTPVPTILRNRGKLFVPGSNPPQTTSISAGSFATLGNPYACAIDFLAITRPAAPAVDSVYYVWDPLLPGSNSFGLGGYQTISSVNGYKPSPGGTINYSNASAYTKIQSGQAFFMHATGAGGTVSFSEAAKIAGSQQVYRPAPTTSLNRAFIRTELYVLSGTDTRLTDAAVVAFDPAFSNRYDALDALKLMNNADNIGIRSEGQLLAIEARKPVQRRDTIFYALNNLRPQVYRLAIGPENLMQSGWQIFLIDQYLGQRTSVSTGDSTYYSFSVTADPGSYASDRFYLVLQARGRSANTILSPTVLLSNKINQPGAPVKNELRQDGIYPNPAKAGTTIQWIVTHPETGKYRYQLLDAAGKRVDAQEIRMHATDLAQTVQLPALAAGIYRVELTAPSGKKKTYSLLIE
jgi:hypothetical protein